MNPVWTSQIVRAKARRHAGNLPHAPGSPPPVPSPPRRVWSGLVREVTLVVVGVLTAALGLKGFLLPSHLIDGGATGLALILHQAAGLPFAPTLVLVNAPFLWLAWRNRGHGFALRALLAIVALALVVPMLPVQPVTQDRLLVAVFGGFFIGCGMGLSIRGGTVMDGTEILAIDLSRKLRTTVGDVILALNIVVFTIGAVVLSVEAAMYSLITYLAASRTADFIMDGIEEYTAVLIVSPKSAEIRRAITTGLGHGVTILSGGGGYTRKGEPRKVDVLYTVVTRLEIGALSREIERMDPGAFVTMHRLRDIRGGVVRPRAGAHA